MPTLEQASPCGPRAQTRQPSVHSRQFAGKPLPCAAGAGRGFGAFSISAASAAATASIHEKAIERICMALKPKPARVPFVFPARETTTAELQIKPFLHPGRVNTGNGRRLPHQVDLRITARSNIAWTRAQSRGHLFRRHAEAQHFARRARTAERKPPNAQQCDDPPHPQTI